MKNENTKEKNFAIGKENYKFLIIGFIIIVIGFLLMIGGGSNDPNVFNKEEMFSAQRIIIAPIIVIFGFAFEVWAIMKKPKDAE
ncbi:MAG TPA: DUF3098 domain-containing protein [Bacteroidales bacterium]|jgi:Protein of unknown function (DUF3098).